MAKKASYLLADIADPDNLRLAFWKARKGKSYSQDVEAYRKNLGKNLLKLRAEILRNEIPTQSGLRGRLKLAIIIISKYMTRKSDKFVQVPSENKFCKVYFNT